MRVPLLKRSAKTLLSLKLLASPRARAVLIHHDVSDPEAPQHSAHYSTTPAQFRAQMEYLLRHFEFVGLEDLFRRSGHPGRKAFASLTFDDGFHSVMENAWPFLRSRGIPFAVFANGEAMRANHLAYSGKYAALSRRYGHKVYLDEGDVRELDRAGVLIGNHSTSHPVLSECDPSSLLEEIGGNQAFLSRLLGKPIRHFALPFGKRAHYDGRVIELCRRTGHDFIYTSNPAPFACGDFDPRSALIPRIGLTGESAAQLRFLINRGRFTKVDL